MPATLSFSIKQARRLALAAQGFNGRQPPATIKAVQLNRLIERLGILQIDSVNALVRSHYLPLFSRLGNYSSDLLDQAAWSSGRRRTLFEYWGHEASLLPLSMYPLMRWRMQRARRGEDIYQQLARFGREEQDTIRRVLASVEEQGAVICCDHCSSTIRIGEVCITEKLGELHRGRLDATPFIENDGEPYLMCLRCAHEVYDAAELQGYESVMNQNGECRSCTAATCWRVGRCMCNCHHR